MIGYCNSSLIPWKSKAKVIMFIFTWDMGKQGKNKNT